VGDLYQAGSDNSDKDNAMLGFIRTLDGNQQWRKTTTAGFSNNPAGSQHGEGMLLWRDCLARNRVFRTLFSDWQNQNENFPDLGEAGEILSNTPMPPACNLTIQGPNVEVGGTTYVGSSTTFKIDAVGSYWWQTSEIQVNAQILPFGDPDMSLHSLTVGPIVGPDQAYNISYFGNGWCSGGPPHLGPVSITSVTLDSTPPTITVPVPYEDQVFDVVDTATFDMNVTDAGSGVDQKSATLDGVLIADGGLIDAFLLDAGDHTIVVNAVDLIGNASSYTRTFSVHATILGLNGAVTRGYAEGLITKPQTPNALQQLLDSAQKSFLRGDMAVAKNKVAAARDLVAGQLESGVNSTFGNRFIGWCNDLIARL
jgi:hypothetical protein